METTIWGLGFRGLDKFQYYPMTENQMEIPMENEMETTLYWVIFGGGRFVHLCRKLV